MSALPVICPTFLREPGQHLWLQVSGAQGPSPSPAQAGCLSDYLTLRHMVPDTSVASEGLSSAYPLASWPLRMFSGAEHGPLLLMLLAPRLGSRQRRDTVSEPNVPEIGVTCPVLAFFVVLPLSTSAESDLPTLHWPEPCFTVTCID